jgi:hypothetical protein
MTVAQPSHHTQEEGSLKVHRSRSVRRAEVTTDGKNLVSRAGTALLSELADRTGLTRAMSEAMADCGISWNTHDPGVVLTHLAVSIADGADCLTDFKALREQPELFGDVASISTAWRAVKATASLELSRMRKAVARAREIVWSAAPPGDITIDFDATLVTSHSEKQDSAATYKKGFGFHPLGAWCDTTSEPLGAIFRPGNAGANDADDHLELLDQVVAMLPADYQLGHEPGDDPSLVCHHILVRADSAGASHGFVRGLVEANVEYSIGHQINSKVREALLLFQEEDWEQAIEANGTVREGAWVAELTWLMDLSSWGEGARLICRRERPHPGAQLSMFDMSEGYRHTCFITNAVKLDGDVPALELRHRGHARVEDRVRNWKDCGLANLPFASFTQNLAWVAASLIAGSLLAWAQMTCLDGELKKAEPKTLRYKILHVAAVLVRRGRRLILRLDETWPWASALQRAFLKLRSSFP